ncbi:MAG: hypothetical protein HGB21_08900 [Nitrospirae bacterium]|nr:hypothetical protein [Nitrospirota bacterium]
MMMKKNAARFVFLLPLAVLFAGTTACVSPHTLPLIEGKEAVAIVNGEPVTLEEYEQEIATMHATKLAEKERTDAPAGGDNSARKGPGAIDYPGLLNRMIDARLVVQEAKRIGLDELPEFKEAREKYSQWVLRTLLMKQALKDVKPDTDAVDALYQKKIREWKLTSVMFPKEEDAKQLAAGVTAGGNFDDLMSKAIAHKKARGGRYEDYQKGDEITPSIYDALLTMGTGSVSPVIPVTGGYALVKVEDFRLQEGPEKKEAASDTVLQLKRKKASEEYVESLKAKLVKKDKELLDSIDFETSLDFEQMTKDERTIAEIAGDGRITVADLADAMSKKYFHGVERKIGKKGLNAKRNETLEQTVEKKVLVQEARNEGLDKTDAYVVLLKTYENSQLFSLFLKRALLPEVKLSDQEIKAYYESHRADFTLPEKMQLDSVDFLKRGDAEETLRKLRAGDQFPWIKAHAEGQVGKSTAESVILGGNIFTITALNDGLRNALSGASAGDFRFYESPEGYFSVISVMAVYPPSVQDYDAVRPLIAKKLYNEHTQASFADWVAKLRSAAEVKVYMNF